MPAPQLAPPDSCPCCPHFDGFHGACRHPLGQDVVRALVEDGEADCPVFDAFRAGAMRELVDELT